MSDGLVVPPDGRRAAAAVASARRALRRVLATGAGLWLARTLPYEPAAPRALVLLDHLSGLLVVIGTEALRG